MIFLWFTHSGRAFTEIQNSLTIFSYHHHCCNTEFSHNYLYCGVVIPNVLRSTFGAWIEGSWLTTLSRRRHWQHQSRSAAGSTSRSATGKIIISLNQLSTISSSFKTALIQYDSKYEFPREKLRLEDELGSGAFGVVLKAIAKNLLPNEDESTVAVKMVKRNYDKEVRVCFFIYWIRMQTT